MSHSEREPSDVAARYQVQLVGEGEFELRAAQGSSPNLRVRRRAVSLSLKAIPNAVHWRAAEGSQAFYVVYLLAEELAIGHRGEEGWSSALADNCAFVIDGEGLRYVPFTKLRILSEQQFNLEKVELTRMRGEAVLAETDANPDRPLARARVVRCPAMPELNVAESLEGTVGLPQEYFQQLLDGCLNRRISVVHLHGIGGAMSSSFQHGEARDLILCAGDGFDISIDMITLDYFV